MEAKKRTPILKNPGVQTLLASFLCILLGLFVGYIVLMAINPAGANEAILMVVKNYMKFTRQSTLLKNMGNTLAKTVPLLMCSLSVLFAYKVGLFNIGAAGQYVAGAGAALYCALGLHMPWYVCLLAAIAAGALLGVASGALKAYFNVNEVISCIMLNWIMLYSVNMLLTPFAPAGMPETETLKKASEISILPTLGLSDIFGKTNYVTIALPMAIAAAIAVWVLLNKTKLGFELRATGLNKHAAKYSGMREKGNLILAMAISGALAGAGAAMYYLTDYQQWGVTQSAVPGMGFNGIAAAFLGGLHPIGAIFSSYFIEHISGGGTFVDKTMYCSEISDLISAVIIYLCGFVLFFRGTMTKLVDNLSSKSTRRGIAVTLVIVALVLALLVQLGNTGKLNNDITKLNAKVEQTTQDKLAVQEKLKAAEAGKKELQNSVKDADKRTAAEQESLAALQAEYEAALAQIEALNAEAEAKDVEMASMEAYLLELQMSVGQALESLNVEPAQNNGEEGAAE